MDRAEQAAPLLYQALYREIAIGTFTDKLGEDVAKDMLSTWYFWQQRFDALMATPDSPWFDDPRTKDKRETLADVIRAAAPRARASIEALQGKDPAAWNWGKAHDAALRQPAAAQRRRARNSSGGFSVQRPGSGETLNRGVYDFQKPYDVNFFAVHAGGGRFCRPRQDRCRAGRWRERAPFPAAPERPGPNLWAAGERRSWWFNPKQVEANAKSRITLSP